MIKNWCSEVACMCSLRNDLHVTCHAHAEFGFYFLYQVHMHTTGCGILAASSQACYISLKCLGQPFLYEKTSVLQDKF